MNRKAEYREVQVGVRPHGAPVNVRVRADKEHKTLVITPPDVLQPWQKAEMKQRAKAASHANWDDRKKARELRRELERQAAIP